CLAKSRIDAKAASRLSGSRPRGIRCVPPCSPPPHAKHFACPAGTAARRARGVPSVEFWAPAQGGGAPRPSSPTVSPAHRVRLSLDRSGAPGVMPGLGHTREEGQVQMRNLDEIRGLKDLVLGVIKGGATSVEQMH